MPMSGKGVLTNPLIEHRAETLSSRGHLLKSAFSALFETNAPALPTLLARSSLRIALLCLEMIWEMRGSHRGCGDPHRYSTSLSHLDLKLRGTGRSSDQIAREESRGALPISCPMYRQIPFTSFLVNEAATSNPCVMVSETRLSKDGDHPGRFSC